MKNMLAENTPIITMQMIYIICIFERKFTVQHFGHPTLDDVTFQFLKNIKVSDTNITIMPMTQTKPAIPVVTSKRFLCRTIGIYQ